MTHTVLLYGATGFSGKRIVAEGHAAGMSRAAPKGRCRMVLAGRDGAAVAQLARHQAMDYRVFGLDDRVEIVRQLHGVDVVLNAAGPFALTADRLAKAALQAGCHYVDINGEVDVYRQLDDLGYLAERLERVLVSGAGHSAAASDILLDSALRDLADQGRLPAGGELGAVRIAMSPVTAVSRGSAQSAWRSLREQVTVVRGRMIRDPEGADVPEFVLHHEPVGMREHAFDFRPASERGTRREPRLAIASAANLVDTLAARLTLRRRKAWAHEIASYVETGGLARLAYPLGAMMAPLAVLPGVGPLLEAQIDLLPEGPSAGELARRHSVLLEIEDRLRTTLVDWRWETPNVYQFTAQLAVAVARRTAGSRAWGWRTPAEVLGDCRPWLTSHPRPGEHLALRDCVLEKRSS